MKQRTYLIIDSLMLTFVACVLEAVNILMIRQVFKYELFSLSLVVPMCCLLQMRWRYTAAPMLAFSGAVFCLCLGANLEQYAIYIVGNLLAMLNLLWFVAIPQSKFSSKIYLAFAFTLTAGLLLVVGRASVAAMLGYSFVSYLKGFLATEAFNIALAMVIVFVAFRQKTLFMYQPHYLKMLQEEREKAQQEAESYQEIESDY